MHQVRLKKKYAGSKTRGKYKSSTNDSVRRRVRRDPSIAERQERAAQRASQPKMVRVLLPSGKTRMIREDS